MNLMRPGTKVRMWAARFDNRPDVEPPGLLKLVGALSAVSFAGAVFFAVYLTLESSGSTIPTGPTAILFAVVHFILPFGVFYSITVNSPLSRIALLVYMLSLAGLTFTGRSLLSDLIMPSPLRVTILVGCLFVVFVWLFFSPKMRFYYAAIGNKPIPPDLVGREAELQGGNWLSTRSRQRIEWFVDHLENLLFGGIALFIFILLFTFDMW